MEGMELSILTFEYIHIDIIKESIKEWWKKIQKT